MKWRVLALGGCALSTVLVFACTENVIIVTNSGPEAGTPLEGASVFRQQVEAGAVVESVYGEAGAPTTCNARPSVSDALLRACILRTSCTVSPPYRLSDCLSRNLVAEEDNASCMQAARSCAAMNECGIEGFAESVCKFGDKGGHCYGTKYVNCDNRPATVVDCAKEGKECVVDDDGPTTKSTFGCLADYRVSNEICEPVSSAVTIPQCLSRTVLAYCQHGVEQHVDCATLGKVCSGGFGTATCRKTAFPSCGDAGASDSTRCSGSVLETCTDRNLHRYTCATAGLACQSTNNVADCRHSSCTADDVKNCKEQCDGPYANLCVGGARVTVDCRQYGMTRCQTYGSQEPGFEGQDFVRCLPEGVFR